MSMRSFSTRDVARVFFTVLGLLALCYLAYLVRSVLGLIFIGIFLAIAMGPAVDFFVRLRVPRGVSILVVFLCLFGAIFLIGLMVVPPVVDQVEQLANDIPGYLDDVRTNSTIREYDDKYDITQKLEEQAAKLPERLANAAGALQAVTVGVFSALVQLLTVLTITFFLLLDGQRVATFVLGQMGPVRKERFEQVAHDVYRSVGGYVAGAVCIALVCGISTYICLTILGVPFAVPLSVLMAFLALIPLVGATIGGFLILLVTLFNDFPTATIVWAVFIVVYQQFENNVLQPFIYKRTVDLHPLAVITAILLGSSLLGVLGALVAIPIAAAFQIVVRDWWVHRMERTDLGLLAPRDRPVIGDGPAENSTPIPAPPDRSPEPRGRDDPVTGPLRDALTSTTSTAGERPRRDDSADVP